jgi:hypothetical protein
MQYTFKVHSWCDDSSLHGRHHFQVSLSLYSRFSFLKGCIMGFFTPVRTLPRNRRPPSKRTFKILFESMLLSQDGQPVRNCLRVKSTNISANSKPYTKRFYGMGNKGKMKSFEKTDGNNLMT